MNDQSEFLQHFLIHQAALRAFVRTLVPSAHEADDVFQQAALVLWKKFDLFEQDRPFLPWARKIVWYEFAKSRALAGRLPTPFSLEALQQIVDTIESHDRPTGGMGEALEHCVETLPEKDRKLLDLRYDQSLSLKDIARRRGGTTAGANMSLSRLRQRLRDCIENRLDRIKSQEGMT